MKLQVKRVTVSGKTKVEFDALCGNYMIKNFSSSPIYVSFDEEFTHNNSIKIPANFYQHVMINDPDDANGDAAKELWIEGSGEVEVQQLWHY